VGAETEKDRLPKDLAKRGTEKIVVRRKMELPSTLETDFAGPGDLDDTQVSHSSFPDKWVELTLH
jgi:hypothetical protein